MPNKKEYSLTKPLNFPEKVDFSKLRLKWQKLNLSLDFDLISLKILNLTDRSQLIAISQITQNEANTIECLLDKRLSQKPLAYILNQVNFFGLNFFVDESVLIPRPETEILVSSAIDFIKNHPAKSPIVADIGCGSGCIGLSVKHHCPKIDLSLLDISPAALHVAQKNADLLHLSVNFFLGNLLKNWQITNLSKSKPPTAKTPLKFDLILANLPYVDPSWSWLNHSALSYEPPTALFAKDNGLFLIKSLLHQAKPYLSTTSTVLLELDPIQKPALRSFCQSENYIIHDISDYVVFVKIVTPNQ